MINNNLIDNNNYSLVVNNDDLILRTNNNDYYLYSHPYEPCLYIKLNNKIIVIIHNSFDISTIIKIAKDGSMINSISGNEYDINKLCELLLFAINNNIYDSNISYIELKILDNNNVELIEDIFYKEYSKYTESVLDYCILKNNKSYDGIKTHKECVIYAMNKWKKELKKKYNINIIYDKDKMKANRIDSKELFNSNLDKNSYCYLFLNPPHGCNYNINDFNKINDLLFPNGTANLEIYDWSTDWSNYFADGLEWWGARCLSIYDKTLNRFIIIGASATD